MKTKLAIVTGWVLVASLLNVVAGQREVNEEQLQKMLRRFPNADLNKDGKLTLEEVRELRLKNGIKGASTETEPAALADSKSRERAAKKARRASGPDIKPDRADVSYGPHPNNKLDLWLAKSDKPTPLVVFIHGGGFVGGDKSSVNGAVLQQCLDAGVSFASINYRFRTEASINVVLRDTARAIQFLRHQKGEFYLDPTRVAAYGGSAGAGSSLWLAFHDDLADPNSDDQVLRESTRLTAAASSAGQATYDIVQWRDVLGSDEAMKFYPQSTWPAFYGLKTLDELQTEKGRQLRADVDMLGLITPDDPPVWLGAGTGHDALANKGDTNHSPKHSEAVKKRCDEVGVTAVLKVGNLVKPDGDGNRSQIDFLLKHLAVKADDSSGSNVPKVSAVSSQPVHPVLIRNEHGPLTRVVVETAKGVEVRMKSFDFNLDGTDDPGDIESLTLYSTGDKDEFSPATPIGEPAKPAKVVTIRGERVLAAGKNVFWLSCQLKGSADLSHQVAATCTAIETTTGKLTPRDDSPGARHRIGVALRRHKNDGVHTYRIPALATSAKGTLLCVYDMRRRMGRDLQEDIGKSAQFMMVRSQDDGLTWSQPDNLTRKLKQEAWWLLAPSPQQGINLPDGTLLMPVEGRDGRDALSTFATIMISRDHGATWTVGKPAFSGGNECQAAQLGDGSIILNMRNDHERFRAVFVTKDLGQTWQPHATNRNTLIEPV